jgi:hypothetical protein
LPFWHTTVVVLPGGTTTVVFCGGLGLELLMQPANNPAATMALNNTFIVDSVFWHGDIARPILSRCGKSKAAAQDACDCPRSPTALGRVLQPVCPAEDTHRRLYRHRVSPRISVFCRRCALNRKTRAHELGTRTAARARRESCELPPLRPVEACHSGGGGRGIERGLDHAGR